LIAAKDVHGGAIDAAVQLELSGQLDEPERARRRQLRQAGYLAQLLFRGVATEDAMVCGSAPGNCALI